MDGGHGRAEIADVLTHVTQMSGESRQAGCGEGERLRGGVATINGTLDGVLQLLQASIEVEAKIRELIHVSGELFG